MAYPTIDDFIKAAKKATREAAETKASQQSVGQPPAPKTNDKTSH